MKSGVLLLTYSHRRDPRANCFSLSRDGGETWSEPTVLVPCEGVDFGYPSTVELDDGALLTLWYQGKAGQPIYPGEASLRLVRWRLPGE